jgi:hypothetical protein
MKGSVTFAINVAIIPDCLAGGVDTVHGCLGNINRFEVEIGHRRIGRGWTSWVAVSGQVLPIDGK